MTWSKLRSSAVITLERRMISGRVPIIVLTRIKVLDWLHFNVVRIWHVRIKHLTGPEQRYHVRRTYIFDAVCVSWWDVDYLEAIAGYLVRHNFWSFDMADADDRLTLEY